MANVLLAARQAATDALGTVSAASSAIISAASIAADVSAVGAAHARAWRDQTEEGLRLTADENTLIGTRKAYMRMARATIDMERELNADDELRLVFDRISAEHANHVSKTRKPLMAAE